MLKYGERLNKNQVKGVAGRTALEALEVELRGRPGRLTPGMIRHMAGEAIRNPKLRDRTVEFLEKIAKADRASETGTAAYKAVATILLIEMLETLKE
jgi:hypothetical protein